MRNLLLLFLTIGLFMSCSSDSEDLSDDPVSQILSDVNYSVEKNKYTSLSSGEIINGQHKEYFDNGEVQADLMFLDGVVTEGTIWHDDRSISIEFTQEDSGELVSTVYSDEGIKVRKIISSADDQKVSEIYTWYDDGTPESEMTPIAVKNWYPIGEMKEMAEYKDGNLDGRVAKWYENGQIAGESFYVNNQLHGDYLEWDEEGNLITEEKYEMGELVE